MGLILDTNFLIAVERERRRGVPGIADAFLARHEKENLVTTFTVVGELACGRTAAELDHWQRLWREYVVLEWTIEIAWEYGKLFRDLQAKGTLIGANDMWIAATALVHGMSVVTNNLTEFQRVNGLTVLPY